VPSVPAALGSARRPAVIADVVVNFTPSAHVRPHPSRARDGAFW
jgi:hypothetical protein